MRKAGLLLALAPSAALLCLGLFSFANRATSLHGEDGVVWTGPTHSPTAAAIEPGSPADLAGLRRGDCLLSIGGTSPTDERGVKDLLWGVEGLPTTYRIQRASEIVDLSLVPRASGEENRIYYYLWVVAMLSLGGGILALLKLPSEPAAWRLYWLCLAFFSLLALSPGGGGGAWDWILYWGDLAGRLLFPPLLLDFVRRLGHDDELERKPFLRAWGPYLPGAALGALALYLIPFRGALAFADPRKVLHWKDRMEVLYLGGFILLAVMALCSKLWTSTRVKTRWRLRGVAASAAAGLIPPAMLYFLPLAWGVPVGAAGEMSVLLVAAVPLGFAASLFRERSLDLALSLRSALRWLTLCSLFAASALASSYLLAYLPGGHASAGILREILVPIAIASVLAGCFFGRLSKAIDSLLGSRPAETMRLLLDFRSELQGEIFIEPLANRLETWMAAAAGVHPVALWVEGPAPGCFVPAGVGAQAPMPNGVLDLSACVMGSLAAQDSILLLAERGILALEASERLVQSGFRYLFPLVFQGKARAILLVGPHRDASPLEAGEVDAMVAVAGQAARSVEAARLYKEIEERSSQQERMRLETEAILESSRIGILVVEGSGVVAAANHASSEILVRSDLVGRPVQEVLPRGLLMLLDRSRKQDREARDRVFRYSLGAADGARKVVNVTRSAVEDDPGARRVYTLDDVTEETVREQKMARQDHLAAMGMLASEVAHEVNTPLTGIASYAQMLMARMKSRLPEMELLKKIESQAFRAAGIAGSVLAFARRKEGGAFEIFEPGPLLSESLALFEPHLRGKRIRLSIERASSLPMIRGQKGRIQQVILNLMLNAAQALPTGGEIRVSADREGAAVRLRISDNGEGIPAAILSRIFEPFFTSRQDRGGTGLGLSVVKQIVQEHEGRIQVESVEGAGTTFTISFPAADLPSAEAAHGA